MTYVNLSAQTEMNPTEGCSFRFVLESPIGTGWAPEEGITVIVDGVEYGTLTLPWGTPSAEETLLLPSGEVHFLWEGGYFSTLRNYFEIYNSLDELIYTSPTTPPFIEELFFTYQNECPDCIPLTDFEGEYIHENKQVNLSWTAPISVHLTGFYIFRNDALLAHVAPTMTSYSDNTANFETGNTYCVVPVYPFSCDLEDECFETTPVGINNYSSGIRLFPNPANSELRIRNYELGITNVEIYDVYGRRQKAESRRQNGEREVIVNVSHLSTGVYFVKITTVQGTVTKKVIKN
jgi:hypothetical protein